ncbi:hypothetical protein GLOTRDRAFT_93972 [Gloeophyllum trabeum ATCC 11539]|uniref:Hsp90 chaperone protein kinase-targeting subunit n=1 Tax=Gloeophyllum trabeum (strain ATCC 11539 / FP-39264 / Madison 617) TaxID=670483 RepID=S7Q4P9_GLOTA|nr:uncharacterized protein GLOTRDRAFT_93972 [Gloeophyllum trabeum ATCC 11539]EPQ54468.1 hypothetical protein GLOTRDRAFT_93972 [Gloeophyllum trabeum ATCC 11539]
MPLNYSKWDNLEASVAKSSAFRSSDLSDDSDIEGHPNVDKRSLIRWKQRDIHEKREARKQRIAHIKAEIACNEVLHPRLISIRDQVSSDGPGYFSSLVDKLRNDPSPDAPPTNAPNQPTYDAMILSLLLQVYEEAKKKGLSKDDPKLGETLVAELDAHVKRLGEHNDKLRKELHDLEEEQKKKITSEDIKEGWENHYVPPKPAPPPVPGAIPDKPKKKTTTTEIEVLNPNAASSSAGSSSTPSTTAAAEDDEDIELPEMTPSLEEFSRLPIRGYEESFHFIQAHRDVVVPGASDALLVAAFNAESAGQHAYAKQCVHQSLLLQYCDKLGKDGVRLFFQKMIAGDKRAETVFAKDVEDTYRHLVERVRVTKEQQAAEAQEQIQLVPENPEQTITFNVPDGPPPEDLRLEGPGTEELDVEEVRKALQMRWDVFDGFEEPMKEALRKNSLEEVNKVLGSMPVAEAEQVVQLLDMAGILNFAEGGIRDETHKDEEK